MKSSPKQERARIEQSLADEQEAHDAEIQAVTERIGLLHARNVEERGTTPNETKPPSS